MALDLRLLHSDERLTLWHAFGEPPLGGAQLPILWGLRGWATPGDEAAACVTTEGNVYVVRTDPAGVVPIYYRRTSDAIWFASRVEFLVRAVDERLHPDWTAWAEIIQFGYPLGAATPFAEIRRLGPEEQLLCHPDGSADVRSRAWEWLEFEAPAGGFADRAQQIVDGLRAELSVAQPLTVPLSGGWDSRLLLACAPDELLADSITVDTDTGRDIEQRYAAGAAAARGVAHRVIEPDHLREYWRDAEAVARATDFQTSLHPWITALVESLPSGSLLADGLAGDVLLKGLFATEAVIEATDEVGMLDALWTSLAPARTPTTLVSEAAAAEWEGAARERLAGVHRTHAAHHSAATLTIYRTRTLRGVSLASSHLLASAADVLTPFTSSTVAAAALSVHPHERHGGDFYRRILWTADPVLARLPSTNDKHRAPLPMRARRELSPGSQAWYADLLLESPVREVLSGPLVLRLQSGRAADLFARRRETYAVRGLALLGLWLRTYDDVLAETRLPASWRGRATTQRGNADDRSDAWLDSVVQSASSNRVVKLSWRAGLHATALGTPELSRERTDGDIPSGDSTIDLLLLDDVLRFIDDPSRLRAEVRRVLAPGGIVAMSSAWPVKGQPTLRPADVHAWVSSVVAPTSVSIREGRIRITGQDVGSRDLRGEDLADALATALQDALGRSQAERRKKRAARAQVEELRAQLDARPTDSDRPRWWGRRRG
jgi:hypothetical protein